MRLAVKGAWVLENLRRLGSGAFYHLAYANTQVHRDLFERLKSRPPSHGRVDIYWIAREGFALHFAVGEVIAIHWFPEFVRVHFMILSVLDGDTVESIPWESDYMLLPSKPNSEGSADAPDVP